LFSGDIEERIKNVSGKKVAGPREYLKITYNEKVYNYISDIRISANENQIGRDFVENILQIHIGDKTHIRLECEILDIPKTIRFEIIDSGEEKIIL